MNPTDVHLITHESRSNVLLVGTEAATRNALREIQGSLRGPKFSWPHDGAPWTLPRKPATLILEDLALIDLADQERLLAWIRQNGRGPQIVSRSSRPIYPLVEQRRFLADLYYVLNVVCVECTP